MTREELIAHWTEKIPTLTQQEMAHLWRFAPAGSPLFSRNYPLFDLFEKRFKELGGMTPAISKAIGLGC